MFFRTFAVVVALCALVVAVVNATGKDHLQKRDLLIRAGVLCLGVVIVFTGGWLTCWFTWFPTDGVNAQHERHELDTTKENPKSIVVHGDTPSPKHPTPLHIKKTIKEAPPLARDTVAKQFEGVPVSWDVTLTHSKTRLDGSALILTQVDGYLIDFPVEFPKHNFLLQAPSGTRLHVDGVVDKADGFNATLKDVSVRLRDE